VASFRSRALVLSLVALLGGLLFLWGLGDTGLVDETPALFAASSRQMAESGDWLIPHVNGLPRYDKPPLVYWLMGGFYALPGNSRWDPLGTWSARLPSALATILTMLALADTLFRWSPAASDPPPARRGDPALQAMGAALAYALSPLVLLWGRTEVSDALFTATLACSLLLAWRTYAAEGGRWWPCWVVLTLAVLSKGPVALVLLPLTLVGFWLLGADRRRLLQRLRPLRGLALALGLSAPWYGLALLREGRPYWDSFFGYHNLQRYTRVVNNHQQPGWYFLLVLVLASLPYTPLLLLSLSRCLREARRPLAAPLSLGRFATAWLLAVLLFFSLSATKLPSYWLVATPAAGVLVALAPALAPPKILGRALACCAAGLLLIGAALAAAPLWLHWIADPSLPGLRAALGAGTWFSLGAGILLLAALPLAGLATQSPSRRLLVSQLALVPLVPALLLPVWGIGDQLRGAPVRALATVAASQRSDSEPLAMVGLRKPSLHYYSRATVLFEGRSPEALVNLADRLRHESRPGLRPAPPERQPHLLVVIDAETAERAHWRDWRGQELARAEPYRLWRLDRRWLEERAQSLRAEEHQPT
jgi:4-amino-4-deoxy-L-arabinose transferase-like glycosyltransferase